MATANMASPETQEEEIVKAWEPKLSPKQVYLMKLCRAKTGAMKFIGVFGTRKSGKSVGCQHAIADHLWNTENGSVLILCGTQGAAATSGIWNELTEKIIPEWIRGDFGMEWVMEPKIHGSTKKLICSVTNRHGGVSKLELDSLDDEREAEQKFKSRYYTMIYWSEAGEFKKSLTLKTLMMALRIMDTSSELNTNRDEELIMLVDANPPDEGQDHFLFKYFYELRLTGHLNDGNDGKEEDAETKKINEEMQKCLHVTEWTMEDNPFLSDSQKAIVKGIYKDDPDLYDRYIRGLWVRAIGNSLFADVFKPAIHVVGSVKDLDPEILIPEDGCSELITSHDAGGVNPVSYIIEKVFMRMPVMIDNKEVLKDVSHFKFLDELAFIGEDISPAEFTGLLLKKMDYWEKMIGRNVIWTDWADSSAVDVKESIAQRTVADEMFAVSGGRIRLKGVDKGKGSVGNRIRLWRRLLAQNRLIISGSKCPKLVEMNQCIQKGRVEGTIGTHSIYKHPFDAASYGVSRECWEELQQMVLSTRNSKTSKNGNGLVSIRL